MFVKFCIKNDHYSLSFRNNVINELLVDAEVNDRNPK